MSGDPEIAYFSNMCLKYAFPGGELGSFLEHVCKVRFPRRRTWLLSRTRVQSVASQWEEVIQENAFFNKNRRISRTREPSINKHQPGMIPRAKNLAPFSNTCAKCCLPVGRRAPRECLFQQNRNIFRTRVPTTYTKWLHTLATIIFLREIRYFVEP